MRTRLPVAALVAAVAFAACDDAATTPTVDDRVNADIAEMAADAVLEDLSVMRSVVPAGGPFGVPGAMDRGGLERDRNVRFYDADGNLQEAFDELTTARIEIETTIEGEIERDRFSASVSRSRDMEVSGLLGEETERTFDGSGESEVSRTRVTDDAGTRSYEMESEAEIDDVVRAVDRQAQPWPLSGTITRHVEVEIENGPNGDESRERTTVLTFNGTQFATLTVDGEEFEVDLAARAAERASRKKGGNP
ncbi:MAG: hypothetical protein KJP18_16010 [Gemmatimonadetes bacterium]|nr:hypothetical protein [Gemmatimonadota bacterium]NNK63662.1 hypothetical protein [Gemmatimonadota bacterium]